MFPEEEMSVLTDFAFEHAAFLVSGDLGMLSRDQTGLADSFGKRRLALASATRAHYSLMIMRRIAQTIVSSIHACGFNPSSVVSLRFPANPCVEDLQI